MGRIVKRHLAGILAALSIESGCAKLLGADFDGTPVGPDAESDADTGGESCASDCAEVGDLRCALEPGASIARRVQRCSATESCLQWVDSLTCGLDQACCDGACTTLQAASACDQPPGPPGYDYYVDAVRGSDDVDDASADTLGTREHPFRTVSMAVGTAAMEGRPSRKVYIAPGRYDAELGETFPLELRGGTSLFGAGPNLVTIRGSGYVDHSTAGGSFAGRYRVTVVAGDANAATTIAGVTLLDTQTGVGSFGVLCDRGSPVPGVTTLDDVTVGPGYDQALTVGTSELPVAIGCNFVLTKSKITGSVVGLKAIGCYGMTPDGGTSTTGPTIMLQIGSTEAGRGNSFTSNGSSMAPFGDVWIAGCLGNSSIRNNVFSSSPRGVLIVPTSSVVMMTIERNTFSKLSAGGLSIAGRGQFTLNDNTFSEVSSSIAGGSVPARALVVYGANSVADSPSPLMVIARRNRFVGNDVAVYVELGTIGPQFVDFGNATDPGGNTLRCNSTVAGAAGSDLWLASPPVGSTSLRLEGNVWDHFPPETAALGMAPNGTDIVTPMSSMLDIVTGTADTTPCPAGRIP
jgi:hypothetical protein